jgi:hypothetical protein
MTLSANAGRPLFVPPGIRVVRTGPTTQVELARLLEDEQVECSGIRLIPHIGRSQGLFQAVADALQLTPRRARTR